MKHTVRRRLTAAVSAAAAIAVLAACGTNDSDSSDASSSASTGTAQKDSRGSSNYVTKLADTHADADDGDYDAGEATTVELADGKSSVDGSGAAVDGDVVTISDPGTYVLSGKLSDGQVVVDSAADGKVRLVLDGVDLTSASTSPVVVKEADEAVVVLAHGSTNTLSDGKESGADDEEEDAPNATLFSMADLTIAGSGSLDVTGVSADGIVSKDGLVILSGRVTVSAADDGVRGKDYLDIEDGTVEVSAKDDGVKADNDGDGELGSLAVNGGTVRVSAGDDGVKAEGAVTVNDGTVRVTKSEEAMEGGDIVIAGGTTDLTSADDGINVSAPGESSTSSQEQQPGSGGQDQSGQGQSGQGQSGQQPPADGDMPSPPSDGEMPSPPADGDMPQPPSDGQMPEGGQMPQGGGGGMPGEEDTGGVLTISGGSVHVNAEGDGLDSNGSVLMTGGDVVVDGPTSNGNGALDVAGDFTVEGGTLLAGGSSGMLVAPGDDSAQAWLVATLDSAVAAGKTIAVQDDSGTTVATYETVKQTQALTVSTADLEDGATYSLVVGGKKVGSVTEGEFSGGFGGPGGQGGPDQSQDQSPS